MSDVHGYLASVFEERAEYLSREELLKWTVTTGKDRATIGKLTGPGAKLLIGPRGSGKSTLLRHAYFELQEQRQHLPVYVNYSKSLALEPLFNRTSNALQIFRQWIVYKIIVSLVDSLRDAGLEVPERLAELNSHAGDFIRELEIGNINNPVISIAPSNLVTFIEDWTNSVGRKRCVLLLDDAAHAFSPEQQREFFEVFRALRSRKVSAKAAVYPGVTSYSPLFHVGHEAELVEAWYRPDDEDYLEVMRTIVNNRLPESQKKRLAGKEDLVDLLALASFGLPRGFLTMLSHLLGVEEIAVGSPTRRRAESAIQDHASTVNGVYTSLATKLPRYVNYIEVGNDLIVGSMRSLKGFNLGKNPGSKAVTIAFPYPLNPEITRVIQLLEYAGLIRDGYTVSRGVKGRFQRYVIHYGLLVDANALSMGRSYSVSALVEAIMRRNAHAFVRTKPEAILGDDYLARCVLDLAPCPNCGAARAAEDASFCTRCGKPLENASVYEELLKSPVSNLPLTDSRVSTLVEHSTIRTVSDIISDEDHTKIRAVPGVGPVWAARIWQYAEEYVSV